MKMSKIEIYGIDSGNSSLKLFNGTDLTVLLNSVVPGVERRLYKQEEGELHQYLDASIESNGKVLGRFFTGELAYKEGGSRLKEESQNGNSKANNEDTYIMELVGLAFDQFNKHKSPRIKKEIILGSGLPTEEFYTNGAVEQFETKLKGHHKITFNHELFEVDGNAPMIELVIPNMITLPESAAAMINHIFDNSGRAIKGREKCLIRLVITVDIGALTTDVSAMEGNSSISNLTFGIPKGLFHAIDLVIQDIEDSEQWRGCRFTRKQVMDALINEAYNIAYKRDDINIKPYLDRRIDELAKEIMETVLRKLRRQRPNIESEAFVTFAVGGSVISMKQTVSNKLEELQVEIPDDPVGANARGYYKSAKQLHDSLHINQHQTRIEE